MAHPKPSPSASRVGSRPALLGADQCCALALVAFVLAAWQGCAHTHEATDKPARMEAASRASQHETARSTSRDRRDEGEGSASAAKAPIAASPAALLKPGAAAHIREKLKQHGYLHSEQTTDRLDGPTERALREFQRDRQMPATGVPDDETIKKLGLNVADIFRSSEKP